jgi:hypothetical protein
MTNLAPDLKGGKCKHVKTTNQTILNSYILEVVRFFVPVFAVSSLYASNTYSEMILNIQKVYHQTYCVDAV